MDKRALSTSLSLACHTLFLIIAFNLVFTPQSISEPVAPPILIHVHLDSRPFSPSMGVHGLPLPQIRPVMAPSMKVAPVEKMHRMQSLPKPSKAMNTPKPAKKPVIARENTLTVVKPQGPALHAPNQHNVKKTVLDTKQIFKDMVVSDHKITTSSIMPVSDVSDQIQDMQIKPSMETTTETFQGETPYLPSEQNGTGTDIQSYLGYELYTYEDPVDHMKYFKLSIKVEEIPGSLPPLPKEINFLVDASGSIGDEPLKQVKDGVEQILQELDGNDKFNVIVFNDVVHKMHERAVSNTLAHTQEAQEFMDQFRSVGNTDLYDTVLKTTEEEHTMKPSYILLISDGEPTLGVTDSLQFINKINEVNQGRVPLFALGIGWANQYLLNFTTFTNHGWAEFVPDNDTTSAITTLYDHIKDPVLINIRYYSIGLNRDDIYPKRLPDLFKGSEFTLYGQYTNENQFLLQMRGDSLTDVKQYVIKDALNNARQGDRDIAQEWAMRKIYELIGQLQYDHSNQTIIDEINQLAAKFDLKIPQYTVDKKN